MSKKWLALVLVLVMVLSFSGGALAETENDNGNDNDKGRPFGDPPGWTVRDGAQELGDDEEPVLVREHPFKDKQIGPPEFVMEMLQKNIHVMERSKFLLNGHPFESELPPVIKEGRTLVPVRALSNALGAEVEWDGEERKVTITQSVYDNEEPITVSFYVDAEDGEMTFLITGGEHDGEHTLDVSAQIFQNRTFVPVRFVAIAFGMEVGYDQLSRTVFLGEVPTDKKEDTSLEALDDDNDNDDEGANGEGTNGE